MKNNIEMLIKEFNKIKNIPLNKSLRKGPTGLGYTFERVLKKREDNSFLPDYNGIEIKTKLGYTKSSLTLFILTPKSKNNIKPIKYILDNFGYPDKNNLPALKGDVYHNYNNLIANKYIFKTKINRKDKKLELVILDMNYNVINNDIYWDLEDIKNRLFTKINYLAYVKGYPYKINNETYYKYTNLYIYKLKTFNDFLNLLEKDLLYLTFNISTFSKVERLNQIHDHGVAFKLRNTCILRLFDKIY